MSNANGITEGALIELNGIQGDVIKNDWNGDGVWIAWHCQKTRTTSSERFCSWDELEGAKIIGYWSCGRWYPAESI